jgi:hypothetical protein
MVLSLVNFVSQILQNVNHIQLTSKNLLARLIYYFSHNEELNHPINMLEHVLLTHANLGLDQTAMLNSTQRESSKPGCLHSESPLRNRDQRASYG